MTTRLIALTSPAMGSGKTTVARHLADAHGFEIISFAAPIKNMVRALLKVAGYTPTVTERCVTGDLKEMPLYDLGDFNAEYAKVMLYELGPLPVEVQRGIGALEHLTMWGMQHFRFGVTPRRLMQTLGTEWGRDSIHPELWALIARDRLRERRAAGRSIAIDDMRFPNEYDMVQAEGGESRRVVRPGAVVTSAHASEGQLDGVAIPEIWNTGTVEDLHAATDRSLFA